MYSAGFNVTAKLYDYNMSIFETNVASIYCTKKDNERSSHK